jgi:hypothetical protein
VCDISFQPQMLVRSIMGLTSKMRFKYVGQVAIYVLESVLSNRLGWVKGKIH